MSDEKKTTDQQKPSATIIPLTKEKVTARKKTKQNDHEKEGAEAKPGDFKRNSEGGIIVGSQHNIRLAVQKLGVSIRHDLFSDWPMIDGLPGFGPRLEDPGVVRLWLTVDEAFKFKPTKDFFYDVVNDLARHNSFHPVLDYLDGLKWDGKKRIGNWLSVYGGAEDSEYTRAVGALWLTAACRRVRVPGAKFDEMLVYISQQQGKGKSTALSVLAVKDEWFTDDLPMNADAKKVIENTRGKWIVEVSELSGMRKATIEHSKGILSRQVDEARMSYGRMNKVAPRQFVIAGSSNNTTVLRDQTGNRRFWPIVIKEFDVASLLRDRDQIWAEASARERTGCSIRLPESLWAAAGLVQEEHTEEDAWFEPIRDAIAAGIARADKRGPQADDQGEIAGGYKIMAESLWGLLGKLPIGNVTQNDHERLTNIMRHLGWRKPNKRGNVKIDGDVGSGWVKGDKPWVSLGQPF